MSGRTAVVTPWGIARPADGRRPVCLEVQLTVPALDEAKTWWTGSPAILTVGCVAIELRPLAAADAAAHCAGEDEETVRWLTGGYGDVEGTTAYFEGLAHNAAAGVGKRGLGVWMSGRLCGYIDYDPDNADGIEPQDVSISYAVHPWARGQGVAVEAVRLICTVMRENDVGTRAVIRVEPENKASVRVAEKSGFRYIRDFPSTTDTQADGTPITLSLYLRDLETTRSWRRPDKPEAS